MNNLTPTHIYLELIVGAQILKASTIIDSRMQTIHAAVISNQGLSKGFTAD